MHPLITASLRLQALEDAHRQDCHLPLKVAEEIVGLRNLMRALGYVPS